MLRCAVGCLGLVLLGCTGEITGAPSIDPQSPDPAGMPPEIVPQNAVQELCGNLLDDDHDGLADEGCACDFETVVACYTGAPATRGVGVCADGAQQCVGADEFAVWDGCAGETLPGVEILDNDLDDDCDGDTDEPDGICVATADDEHAAGACTNDKDDDCDGTRDCDDDECAATFACNSPCPDGETPVFWPRDLGTSPGASSIEPGDGEPIMPMTCEPDACSPDQVGVAGEPTGPITCVDPPPPCEEGSYPTYFEGAWRCDPPCEVIVHYGGIYGGVRVCAGNPELTCPPGQVPTFRLETETWECVGQCDGGLYDPALLGGEVVCIPC